MNFVDMDPYGQPWPVLDAFFAGHKPQVPKLMLVVNDGLRQKIRSGGAWRCVAMHGVVERMPNNDVFDNYLFVCKDLVMEKARAAGYSVTKWTGYYCGNTPGNSKADPNKWGNMTHYAALLTRNDLVKV